MGIYDRDYLRSSTGGGGFGSFRSHSINTWIIAINVAIFLLSGLLRRAADPTSFYTSTDPLYDWGYFSMSLAVFHGQVWRFVTYQFLHSSISHIFWNMLGLYFFGPLVEGQLGGRRYLGFYLSCGIAGALMYIALWASNILLTSADVPMVGASAGIYGVILAAAKIAPGLTITLWFPPIPVTLRVLAWVYIGMALYAVLTSGGNAGGEAAHLGGGLWGFILIHNEHWLDFLHSRMRIGPRRRRRVAFRDWSRDLNH